MAKAKCPEFENHERWLVSYADMVTLLFAVFVVLFALKEDGSKASQDAAGSLQESFNKPLEDIPVEHRVGPTEQGFGIFEHMRGNSVRPPLTKKFPGLTDNIKIIEEEMNRVHMQIEERLYGPEKFPDARKPGEERIVAVERTKDGFKLRLLARHFYDPGDTHIKRGALKDLNTIAKILRELGRPIMIEGHTDSSPPQGDQSNWDLSALRATHVLQYLVREHNFPATKLGASGYADTRPMANNSTEQGRVLNRRIEIKVEYDPNTHQDSE